MPAVNNLELLNPPYPIKIKEDLLLELVDRCRLKTNIQFAISQRNYINS